jgi:HPt (histidine-containing phosphotransfer) domain-containing protein
MVLYERNGNFIGIGKEELLFLGYEDFEEFKSEHKDFADLFVNRPGYIFKFKNFSWIDYTLHSGAPKKSVILKLKNAQEVEVNIKISEIFLLDTLNNQNSYFGVELLIGNLQNQALPINTSHKSGKTRAEETSLQEESPFLIQDYKEEELNYEYDTEDIKTEEIKINFDDSENLTLKTDEEPLIQNESLLKTEQEQEDETLEPKLKIDLTQTDEQSSFEEVLEDLPQETTLFKEDSKEESTIPLKGEPQVEEHEDFDLVLCAQDIGLDLSELATLLEEYLQNIQEDLNPIKNAISENDQDKLRQFVLPLKGIAENLQMKHMANSLGKIISEKEQTEKDKAYEHFSYLAKELEAELI